jgi:hypothetical protein
MNKSRFDPTLLRGASIAERYRDHLIFIRAILDPQTRLWSASAHVQFNEGPRVFRDLSLPRPAILFTTEKGAERYMVREARRWVDDRLGETERPEASRKAGPRAFWRSLFSMLANYGAKADESNSN